MLIYTISKYWILLVTVSYFFIYWSTSNFQPLYSSTNVFYFFHESIFGISTTCCLTTHSPNLFNGLWKKATWVNTCNTLGLYSTCVVFTSQCVYMYMRTFFQKKIWIINLCETKKCCVAKICDCNVLVYLWGVDKKCMLRKRPCVIKFLCGTKLKKKMKSPCACEMCGELDVLLSMCRESFVP